MLIEISVLYSATYEVIIQESELRNNSDSCIT